MLRRMPNVDSYVIGSEFRGFHVRFQDVARGGIRIIRSSHTQVYLNNASPLFDECYGLASTQHRKNKDIPEGGSKGVVLLNQACPSSATSCIREIRSPPTTIYRIDC
ncbi:Glutamate dehydrogenase 2 [Phytophthora nicotianae]|uniref:Glutamate dehydrogenase 2 n=1 Tax=Phytophthora nicotianae TaxID=4792 RepID=A0A0W8DX83_PHYNI|nr:Glutamate dehydrogenase 2 [Phytophthora nicotianae]